MDITKKTPNHENSVKYCTQCGSKISQTAEQCDFCGKKVSKGSASTSSFNSLSTFISNFLKDETRDLWYKLSLASPIIVIFITLQKWFHFAIIDSFSEALSLFTGSTKRVQSKYSLFGFSKLLDNLNQFADSGDIQSVSIVLKVMAIAVILVQAYYIYTFIKNPKNIKKVSVIATVVTCFVSVMFLIAVGGINADIAEETQGFINASIKATMMPYLAILFSIFGAVGVHKGAAFNSKGE